jgi:hypothetical protein
MQPTAEIGDPTATAGSPTAKAVKGRLVGRISNRTQGGILVPNLEIFLEKYINQNPTEKIKTLTDCDGYFQFVDLPLTPENSYRVSLKYQGVDYSGHPFSFAQGENLKTMEIGVYDATDSPEKIKISMKHIFVDIENNIFKISEAVRLENIGNTTYRGPLRFSLPEGFENLQFERGIDTCCSEIKESGFSENMPFYPGMKEVTYSYQLKYDSSKYLFTPAIDYPTENLDLMIRDLGIKLESKRLVFISAIDMGEKKYLRLSAKALLPNEKVEIKISGLPLGPEGYRVYVLVFAGLIVLLGIVYPFLRKKPVMVSEESRPCAQERDKLRAKSEEKKGVITSEELLKEIAELDDHYAAGEIETGEYEKLRAKKKKILIKLLRHRLVSNKTNNKENEYD